MSRVLICSICQKGIEFDVLCFRECLHIFHRSCGSEWVLTGKNCPICHKNIQRLFSLFPNFQLLKADNFSNNFLQSHQAEIDFLQQKNNCLKLKLQMEEECMKEYKTKIGIKDKKNFEILLEINNRILAREKLYNKLEELRFLCSLRIRLAEDSKLIQAIKPNCSPQLKNTTEDNHFNPASWESDPIASFPPDDEVSAFRAFKTIEADLIACQEESYRVRDENIRLHRYILYNFPEFDELPAPINYNRGYHNKTFLRVEYDGIGSSITRNGPSHFFLPSYQNIPGFFTQATHEEFNYNPSMADNETDSIESINLRSSDSNAHMTPPRNMNFSYFHNIQF